MPIPKPRPKEKQDAYISRCMQAIGGEYDDNDQAVAVCYSTWREAKKKSMSVNAQLVQAIRKRQKSTEFNYGIATADAYVRTLQQCVGSDLCYRYAAKGNTSFDDIMRKAAHTLTYSNPEMVVEEKATDIYAKGQLPDGIDLPKNTLMVFRHVLTTPRKDRDGDILRTQGAELDPKMLLLWQHVHTLPIGKYLGTDLHNSKKLTVYSAIVDLNELSHDAAVMVDNDMGRFSHGFRAVEFDNLKEEGSGKTSGKGGFDVKRFEIMEESLVSVPSNVTAEVEEVILSLVDSKQLKSPLMKRVGTTIREKRPMTVPVKIDLNLSLNGKNIDAERSTEKGGGKEGCTCGGASAEADGKANSAEGTDDKEVMLCPKCGAKIVNGVCEKCGAKMGKDADVDEEKATKQPKECPECGAPLNSDGICEECGYGAEEDEDEEDMEEEKDAYGSDNADADNDMGTVLCPVCGTIALVDGRCPKCGRTATGKSYRGGNKGYVSGSSISGSWENIQSSLYEKATAFARLQGISFEDAGTGRMTYVYSLATFDGSAILAVSHADGQTSYHRAEWKMVDGEPKFVGTLKEVNIEVNARIIEKAKRLHLLKSGRVLSSKNKAALKSVRDGMQEIHDKEMLMSKGGRAICREGMKTLDDVMSSAEPMTEVSVQSEISVKEAVAVVLTKATADELDHVVKAIEAVQAVEKRSQSTQRIRTLLGR